MYELEGKMKEIIDFLEANVNGKTLYTKELVYQLEEGVLEGVYADQISFSNLKYSQSGFQFDMFIVSNEKIWLVGKDGQREALRKDFSGVSLFRFELAKRKVPMICQVHSVFYPLQGKTLQLRLSSAVFMTYACKMAY